MPVLTPSAEDESDYALGMSEAAPMAIDDEWFRSLPDQAQKRFALQMSLSSETDRGAAIIGVSYLDTQLERLFERVFVSSRSHARRLLKGPGAPAGTFSSRIDLAHALALIGSHQHQHLHVFRDIRNKFAHTYEPLSFEATKILAATRKLQFPGMPAFLLTAPSRIRFEFALTLEMSRLEAYVERVSPIEYLPDIASEIGEFDSPEYRSWIARIQSIQAGKEPEPRTWYPDPYSDGRMRQPQC